MNRLFQLAFALVACTALAFFLSACSDAPEEKKETMLLLKDSPAKVKKAESQPVKAGKSTFVTIGTGGITGVYYPAGGAIANIVNMKRDVYGIRATVESTGGSVFNINAVLAGDLQFGIAQSDRQFQACNGLAEWAKSGPQGKLRSVFSLHPETVTLVAGADTGIKGITDLKGRKVNLGNHGSGQLQNSLDALAAVGMSRDDLISVEAKATESPAMLQAGIIDAFFYTVGHPSGAIKEVCGEGSRKINIVPITGLESLFAKYPYYVPSVVPMSEYPGAANAGADVPSFGVKATLVTSADVPDDIVYAVTREVFENLEELKKLHPAFALLTRKCMLQGLTAPIHPGAMKYYKEVELK